MNKFYKLILALFVFSICALPQKPVLADTYSGKIYLQVEQNGEAWYINPTNNYRYYLGRPDDAFNIMRNLGLGASNATLSQIPVGILNYGASDFDLDGLADNLEIALGTSVDNPDTDNDDYSDKAEVEAWFNPLGTGKWKINTTLVNQLRGRILLQVEKNGEAWYLNPNDNKRYYLGRPNDAFAIMRMLGTGITDANLAQIKETFVGKNFSVENHYSISYPGNWTVTSETPRSSYTSTSPVHKAHFADQMGAAQMDIFVYETTGTILSLQTFDVSSKSYDPEKYVETFNIGTKPARLQTLKYDTIAEFKGITFNKGKRIFLHVMISPKKVIGIEYSILDEVNIANYEQIFQKILTSFKPVY